MAERRSLVLGHACALFAALNWGFTFILTDMLLQAGLTAYQALLLRSLTAYVFLWLICPRLPKVDASGGLAGLFRGEWPYIVAGLCGLSVYFMLDYTALNYTSASFVTILCGTVPLFMAVAVWIAYREPPQRLFLVGFVIAVAGVALVSLAGGQGLEVSALGGGLVLASNVLWAIYAVMTRRIDEVSSPVGITGALLNLRRIFFWGVISLLAGLPLLGFDVSSVNLLSPGVLVPVGILGIMTSALTFLAYSLSIRWLGVAKASVYQYFPPAVGAVAAHFLLGETITLAGAFGIAVVIVGLLISERASGDAPSEESL